MRILPAGPGIIRVVVEPSPESIRLRAALRGNQEATNQFFRAIEGMIPHEAFFNPQNLRQIVGAHMAAAR